MCRGLVAGLLLGEAVVVLVVGVLAGGVVVVVGLSLSGLVLVVRLVRKDSMIWSIPWVRGPFHPCHFLGSKCSGRLCITSLPR